jgi:hypothetical protein
MNSCGQDDEVYGSIKGPIFCLVERLFVSEAKIWFFFMGVKFDISQI